jgi:hypothetical protein
MYNLLVWLTVLSSLLKTSATLRLENLALRQQLSVLRGCVATFKKQQEADWSSRPGAYHAATSNNLLMN